MASLKVAFLAAVLCMVVVSAPMAHAAITCGQVTNSLINCIGYLQNGGTPPSGCCNGVKSLNAAAKTTADRQTACNCLKSAASQISGFKTGMSLQNKKKLAETKSDQISSS